MYRMFLVFLLLLSSSLALSLAGNSLLLLLDSGRSGDRLVDLSENNLHVARVGHEGVDTTVGAIQTTADLGGSVHLNVANVQQIVVQVLERRVGLSVGEEIHEELAGLLGPTGERARNVLVLLGLSSTANSTDGTTERNGILVVQDALQESLSLLKTHSTDGVGNSVGVLEVDTQVGALSLSRYTFAIQYTGSTSPIREQFRKHSLGQLYVHTTSREPIQRKLNFPTRHLRTLCGVLGSLINRGHAV